MPNDKFNSAANPESVENIFAKFEKAKEANPFIFEQLKDDKCYLK